MLDTPHPLLDVVGVHSRLSPTLRVAIADDAALFRRGPIAVEQPTQFADLILSLV